MARSCIPDGVHVVDGSGVRMPDGVHVVDGTRAFYSTCALHRMPSFYRSCTTPEVRAWADDCELFRPEHWLVEATGGTHTLLKHAATEFITFHAGERGKQRDAAR